MDSQFSYLFGCVQMNAIFSRAILQEGLDQDKSWSILSLFMVGDLMRGEINFVTFAYFKFNSEINTLFCSA